MSLSVVTLALETTLEVRQLFYSGESLFFPAVTVAFRGGLGCLACFEDFSVVLLNYGL